MDLSKIETERRSLEENVAKLEKSLRHWQLWEAEYEGLREEIDALPPDASRDDLLAISTNFAGDVVTQKEIHNLIGPMSASRKPKQVSGILSRRLDYTLQNVQSLAKQLEAAQEQLDPSDTVVETGLGTEEGHAMAEIIEELDEDDRVISSRLSNPNESADDVLKSLKRAGLSEQDWADTAEVKEQPVASAANPSQSLERALEPDASVAAPAIAQDPPKRKSVSFAPATKPDDTGEADISGSNAQPGLSDLTRGSFSSTERVWELDENDQAVDFVSPHIPVNESPEDAALRRQMLQYNFNEVGAVVGQLDLEEMSSSDESDEDDGYSDMTGDSDEDEHGMSTRSMLTDDYREEMRRLEEKLNAQSIQNVGPQPVAKSEDISLGASPFDQVDESVKNDGKKSVRFANTLDIAPVNDKQETGTTKSAISAQVRERTERNAVDPVSQAPPQKVSRFKAARGFANQSRAASQLVQKKGVPLSEEVVERAAPTSSSDIPPHLDELSPEQLRKELTQNYYRQRNNLIRRQGGFLEDDHDTYSNDDEEDADDDTVGESLPQEPQKKVSRFKAARVKPDKVW